MSGDLNGVESSKGYFQITYLISSRNTKPRTQKPRRSAVKRRKNSWFLPVNRACERAKILASIDAHKGLLELSGK